MHLLEIITEDQVVLFVEGKIMTLWENMEQRVSFVGKGQFTNQNIHVLKKQKLFFKTLKMLCFSVYKYTVNFLFIKT